MSTRRVPGISPFLAVGSGKGGIGKTPVALNLALALHLDGRRLARFDADPHGPNIPLMLCVYPKPLAARPLNISAVPTDRRPDILALQCFGPEAMPLGLLVGTTNTIRADGRLAGKLICRSRQDVLCGGLDVLLLDFPAGTGEPQQTLLNSIHRDGRLLVMTPHPQSWDRHRSCASANHPGLARGHSISLPGSRGALPQPTAAAASVSNRSLCRCRSSGGSEREGRT